MPVARLVVGPGDDDGRDPLHLRPEADVEVPLVGQGERLDAVGDRVAGQAVDIGLPVGVGREPALVVAADPVEELGTALVLGDLDGVVQAHEAHALVHQLLELVEVVALDHGMLAAAVHEEDERAGAVEDGLILGPAAGDDDRLDAGDLAEALGEQLAAGVELVLARPVAGPAGDQYDLGGVGASPGAATASVQAASRGSNAKTMSWFITTSSKGRGSRVGWASHPRVRRLAPGGRCPP